MTLAKFGYWTEQIFLKLEPCYFPATDVFFSSKKYGDFVPFVFIEILWRICSPLFFLSPSDEISPPRKEKKRKEKKRKTLLKLLSLNLLFNYGNLEFFLSRRGES
jgi:hypothetical protein